MEFLIFVWMRNPKKCVKLDDQPNGKMMINIDKAINDLDLAGWIGYEILGA